MEGDHPRGGRTLALLPRVRQEQVGNYPDQRDEDDRAPEQHAASNALVGGALPVVLCDPGLELADRPFACAARTGARTQQRRQRVKPSPSCIRVVSIEERKDTRAGLDQQVFAGGHGGVLDQSLDPLKIVPGLLHGGVQLIQGEPFSVARGHRRQSVPAIAADKTPLPRRPALLTRTHQATLPTRRNHRKGMGTGGAFAA